MPIGAINCSSEDFLLLARCRLSVRNGFDSIENVHMNRCFSAVPVSARTFLIFPRPCVRQSIQPLLSLLTLSPVCCLGVAKRMMSQPKQTFKVISVLTPPQRRAAPPVEYAPEKSYSKLSPQHTQRAGETPNRIKTKTLDENKTLHTSV